MEELNKQILEKLKEVEGMITKKNKDEETEKEIEKLRNLLKRFVEEEK